MSTENPTVTKRRVLLDLSLPADHAADIAVYEPGPDMEVRVPEVCLSHADFMALGSPEQITVTIEPGDLLNGADQ
jgi:hypothetical protein